MAELSPESPVLGQPVEGRPSQQTDKEREMADGNEDSLAYVVEQAELTQRRLLYMTLAGVLAGVGLLLNSVPILVGAALVGTLLLRRK